MMNKKSSHDSDHLDDVPTVPSRRTVVRASGLAAAGLTGVGVVAGCGSDDSGAGGSASGTASPGSSTRSSGGGSGSSGGTTVAASDVPVGGGKILKDAKIVVTQPSSGTYKAFSAVCTHQQCLVTSVEDNEIVCPCHGSKFSIEDGSVKSGPADDPLPAKSVTKSGTNLTVA